MKNINSDIRNHKNWKRCTRRVETYEARYSTSGTSYINPLDDSMSRATINTPILLRCQDGFYSTMSVDKFIKQYETLQHTPITEELIQTMRNDDYIQVLSKSIPYWVFYADIETYGWNCSFGINIAGKSRGKGDYVICRGKSKPEVKTSQPIHHEIFNKHYIIREESTC